MTNLLEQGFYLGLGALSLTAEKTNDAINAVLDSTNLTDAEGKQLSARLLEEGKKARQNLEETIQKILNSGKVILPQSKEVTDLKQKIADLEKELADLKGSKA